MAHMRRSAVLAIVCILGVILLSSISLAQTDHIETVPAQPQGGFILAEETTEFTAEAFVDSLGYWTNDANAYDGDFATFAYQSGACVADEYPSAYGHTFDSAEVGEGTISQVDIIVRMQVTGLTGSSDYWALTLDVSASTGNALSGTQYNLALTNLTYTDVTEPNGGGWSWTEVRAIQLHIDTEKDKGADGGQINVYEFAVKVTYEPPSGTQYDVTIPEVIDIFDSVDTSVNLSLTMPELIDLYDSITTSVNWSLTVAELIEIFDSVSTSLMYYITINELLEVLDSVSTIGDFGITISELIEILDSVNTVGNFGITVSELIEILDSVSVELGGGNLYYLDISELIEILDSLTTSVNLSLDVSELIELYDSVNTVLNPVEVISLLINEVLPIAIHEIIEGGLEGLDILYDLFLSGNMWSLIGPMSLVVAGFFISRYSKSLGLLWIIFEWIFAAYYFELVEAHPDYWWHIFFLIVGGVLVSIPAWMSKR